MSKRCSSCNDDTDWSNSTLFTTCSLLCGLCPTASSHVHSVMWKSRTVQFSHMVRRDSSASNFDRVEITSILLYLLTETLNCLRKRRNQVCLKKTLSNMLKKMLHSKASKFKSQTRLELVLRYW